jgi:hypothetical protein
MSLRLSDIRNLEQEKQGFHNTIRSLTSRVDELEMQLAETKDELRQVLLTCPLFLLNCLLEVSCWSCSLCCPSKRCTFVSL